MCVSVSTLFKYGNYILHDVTSNRSPNYGSDLCADVKAIISAMCLSNAGKHNYETGLVLHASRFTLREDIHTRYEI